MTGRLHRALWSQNPRQRFWRNVTPRDVLAEHRRFLAMELQQARRELRGLGPRNPDRAKWKRRIDLLQTRLAEFDHALVKLEAITETNSD